MYCNGQGSVYHFPLLDGVRIAHLCPTPSIMLTVKEYAYLLLKWVGPILLEQEDLSSGPNGVLSGHKVQPSEKHLLLGMSKLYLHHVGASFLSSC